MIEYTETEYHIHDRRHPNKRAFTLMIGKRSMPLAAMMMVTNSRCAAFISASNPMDQELPMADNLRRAAELKFELIRRGYNPCYGDGQHPASSRRGEPSVFVMDADLRLAMIMGHIFKQRAIVWCDSDAVPQLHMING